MSPRERRAGVRITLRNESSRQIRLVLEPQGEIHPIAPQSTRTVIYWGDPVDHLSVDIGDDELKLWSDSTGWVELEEDFQPESQ